MTPEQAKLILEEALKKINEVFENKQDLIHSYENFGNSLETAITLIDGCIDDLSDDSDE
ncbi:hypothetical protein [Nostoc sp. C052]|uniref:hypothetical protein n=1 Tax=Nostoc sp. C052 TaxID=2576902 RepID=UPI0015C403CF|nr:hypothetical protein [Nostoc sp. C052]